MTMTANEAREALQQIKAAQARNVVEVGLLLEQFYDSKADIAILIDDDALALKGDGEPVKARWNCWMHFCGEYLDSDGKYIHSLYICAAKLWRSLPESHQKLLPELTRRRIREVAAPGLREKNGFLDALESAPHLAPREWEVELNVLKGRDEDEAQVEMERRREKAREAIRGKNTLQFWQDADGPWKSEEFRKFVRTLPCAVCLKRGDDIDPAHIKTVGSGGDDYLNVIPLCRGHHTEQHDKGWTTFSLRYLGGLMGPRNRAETTLKAYIRYLEES